MRDSFVHDDVSYVRSIPCFRVTIALYYIFSYQWIFMEMVKTRVLSAKI